MSDANGEPLMTPDNLPIFGFSRQKADGSWENVPLEAAGWDPATRATANGVVPVTEPLTVSTPLEAAALTQRIAGEVGVDPNQLVGSLSGLSAVVRPVIETEADGSRIASAMAGGKVDLEATAQLASHPINWIDAGTKARILDSGLSDDSLNWAVHAISVNQGWTDPESGATLNAPLVSGVDFSTDLGMKELENHLAGKNSSLDNVNMRVNHEVLTGVLGLAVARDLAHGEGSAAREATISLMETEAADAQRQLSTKIVGLEANPDIQGILAYTARRSSDTASNELSARRADLQDQISTAMLSYKETTDPDEKAEWSKILPQLEARQAAISAELEAKVEEIQNMPVDTDFNPDAAILQLIEQGLFSKTLAEVAGLTEELNANDAATKTLKDSTNVDLLKALTEAASQLEHGNTYQFPGVDEATRMVESGETGKLIDDLVALFENAGGAINTARSSNRPVTSSTDLLKGYRNAVDPDRPEDV